MATATIVDKDNEDNKCHGGQLSWIQQRRTTKTKIPIVANDNEKNNATKVPSLHKITIIAINQQL